MMYDLTKVKERFDNAVESQGFHRPCPINVNSRLNTCLGRVCYHANGKGGIMPIKVEFSEAFLNSATEEDIEGVILHEAAHLLVALERPTERHQHDKVFREMCSRLGCSNNRAKTSVSYDEKELVKLGYKYFLYCEKCGQLVAKYKTRCKAVKEYKSYYCRKCRSDLRLVEAKR